jgi:hypothetical protein
MQELSAADRLEQGKAAVQARDNERARALLQPLVEAEPANAEAWLWLSGAQSSPREMAACLRRVLELEPGNQDALDTMAWLESRHGRAALAPVANRDLAPAREQPASPRSAMRQPEELRQDEEERAASHASEYQSEQQSHAPRRAAPAPRTSAAPRPSSARIYPVSPYARPFDRRQIMEYGLAVGGVGALIGLLRLAGALRPGTLLLIRGSDGPITPIAAGLIAMVAAAAHGLAMIAVWQILARTLAGAREDRPGDIADTLGRLAPVFWPGYGAALALLLVAASLGASQQRWGSVVVVVWLILLLSVVVSGLRLLALCRAFGLDEERPGAALLRMILPALLVGVLALGIAGLVVRGLLAAL